MKMKSFKTTTLIASLTCMPLAAQGADHYLGIDISDSVPYMTSPSFANRIADAMINIMAPAYRRGDLVHLSTLGEGGADDVFKQSILIRNQPSNVIYALADYVRSIPGNKEPQTQTRLRSYFVDSQFNCTEGSMVIVLTDGVPYADEVDTAGVIQGQSEITPVQGLLNNCHVTFIGIGVDKDGSLNSTQKANIRNAWKKFVTNSGGTYSDAETR